jgi:hypothetical protein
VTTCPVEHEYWSIVESCRLADGRGVQRHVLYLGEINDAQERAMRRKQLNRLWKRLQQLQGMKLCSKDLLMKLGAARQQAPGAWRLVHVEVDAGAAAAPDHGHTSSNGGPDVVETLGQEHRFRPRQGGSNPRIREVGLHAKDSEQVVSVPASPEAFACDAALDCLSLLEQHQGDPTQPREVLGGMGH